MQKQVTVFSGVLIHNKKILMVQRNEPELAGAHLKWEFPGGKCDFGETPQESLKREFLEETGVEVEVKELLPFVKTNYWEYDDVTQQTFCFLFLCTFVREVGVTTKDHHVYKTEWFTAEDIRDLDALPGTSEVIEVLEQNYPDLID